MGSPTTNYGWIKPTVGADTDAWGGELNTDLDGIDSTVFAVSGVANAALPKAGGTLTGGLTGTTATFSGAAQAATPAAGDNSTNLATTAWVQANARYGDSRIINGDMRIDQRNNGASGTAAGVYTVDRWAYFATQTSKGAWVRSSGPVSLGFPYMLQFTSSSAYTPLATDNFGFWQPIEADMISDFAWGTANAQPVTLSFWVMSTNRTGTFSGALQNYAQTRAYPFSYSIAATSTWYNIIINIPGDTAGTWVLSGNAGSVYLIFDLGSGANFRGPANAWATTTTTTAYQGVTGAQSIVSTNGSILQVTGVKLEIGSVATPYNRQSLAKSLADCQRHYQRLIAVYVNGFPNVAGGTIWTYAVVPPMRAIPTATLANTTYSNASGFQATPTAPNGIQCGCTVTTTGFGWAQSDIYLSSEL